MNWEETILHIREDPEFEMLITLAYMEEDLELNVKRFQNSGEFKATLKLLERYCPHAQKLIDLGCGNGTTSASFALHGFDVIAVEPNPSLAVGAGAVRELKQKFSLENLKIVQDTAEELELNPGEFDVVYCRQSLHHASDLLKFVANAARFLRPGGIFMTTRDHVVFDEKDKIWFLENHPLQKFYGGENAYSPEQYKTAFQKAGLRVLLELKYWDSIINFYPLTRYEISKRRYRFWFKTLFYPVWMIYNKVKQTPGKPNRRAGLDEKEIPGRMYSFLAIKD